MVLKVNPVPEKHKMSHKKKKMLDLDWFFSLFTRTQVGSIFHRSLCLCLGFFFFFAEFFLGLSLAVQAWEQKYILEDEIY